MQNSEELTPYDEGDTLALMQNWLALRNAIVIQASNDWKDAFRNPEGEVANIPAEEMRKECERFFRGKWCAKLLGNDYEHLSGKEILLKLKEQTLREIKEGQEMGEMKVTLVQATPYPIEMIAQVASICYDSTIGNKKAFVRKLYKSGHHSPFEHVYFTFKIEGISRACSHQLVRHRLAAITQRSQRYCEENGFDYVVPPEIRFERDEEKQYKKHMEAVNDLYCDMIHLSQVKKEDARYLLPNACTTEMYFSCNLREMIHIANERLCSRAQWEIRKLVSMMVNTLDEDIRWMMQPKCCSGFSICYTPCERNKDGYVILKDKFPPEKEKKSDPPEEKEVKLNE